MTDDNETVSAKGLGLFLVAAALSMTLIALPLAFSFSEAATKVMTVFAVVIDLLLMWIAGFSHPYWRERIINARGRSKALLLGCWLFAAIILCGGVALWSNSALFFGFVVVPVLLGLVRIFHRILK